jgi:hypothetical protein
VFLLKLTVPQLVKKYQSFMETVGTSPCSNQNPEPDKTCPPIPIIFFKANFNITLEFTSASAKKHLAQCKNNTAIFHYRSCPVCGFSTVYTRKHDD